MKKGPLMARHIKQEDCLSRGSSPKEISLEILDPKTRKRYIRGKFLGKVQMSKASWKLDAVAVNYTPTIT